MKKIYIALLVLLNLGLKAQGTYFIYLKDKNNSDFKTSQPEKFLSERSIKRRITQGIPVITRDLPVNTSYISDINKTGAKVMFSSKWLNATLVSATSSQFTAVKNLSFVKSVEGNSDIKGLKISAEQSQNSKTSKFEILEDYQYGGSQNQIDQLEAAVMHKKGFTGKGILIGVLDSGFSNADKLDVFKHLFTNNRIKDTYDFVNKEKNVFNDDSHGTSVLSCIVGNALNKLIGTAPDAEVALYTTEDVSSETRLEEINWLLAAERADSLGVDVINSSLGYNIFDNPAQNYTYADMNGDKTICAKAADFAVATGIIVVVSAGNEGNRAWKYINTPADADSVLSIGAIDVNKNYVSFSSQGPNAKNAIKPELVARGASTTVALNNNTIATSNGTSFSSPLMAGFVASLRQAYNTLPAMKMRELLIKSGSQYNTPDNFKGYGLPTFSKMEELTDKYIQSLILSKESESNIGLSVFPNPYSKELKLNIELLGSELDPENIVVINDMIGKELINCQYKNLNKQLIYLQNGLYIVSIIKEGKSLNVKLFVK